MKGEARLSKRTSQDEIIQRALTALKPAVTTIQVVHHLHGAGLMQGNLLERPALADVQRLNVINTNGDRPKVLNIRRP